MNNNLYYAQVIVFHACKIHVHELVEARHLINLWISLSALLSMAQRYECATKSVNQETGHILKIG